MYSKGTGVNTCFECTLLYTDMQQCTVRVQGSIHALNV